MSRRPPPKEGMVRGSRDESSRSAKSAAQRNRAGAAKVRRDSPRLNHDELDPDEEFIAPTRERRAPAWRSRSGLMPVIALVGRPNVGKSTLFNQLTRTRDALVADVPGLTRDRQYGIGRVGDFAYFVVDTGGLDVVTDEIEARMGDQTARAIEEADCVVFMVDGRSGVTTGDHEIAARLRRSGRNALLVMNKTDGLDPDVAASDAHALGMGQPLPIAAAHGRGVRTLMNEICTRLAASEVLVPASVDERLAFEFDNDDQIKAFGDSPDLISESASFAEGAADGVRETPKKTPDHTSDSLAILDEAPSEPESDLNRARMADLAVETPNVKVLGPSGAANAGPLDSKGRRLLAPATLEDWPGIRVALVGRPNVGKSTLTNRLLGEDRVVATPIAGTTRDSIFIPFEREGEVYTLIDTAGIRRRGRVSEVIEKFSVVKTLQAIEAAHVVVFVLDSRAEIADQDAHLLGLVLEAGRALVIAVNKWDGLDEESRDRIRSELERKLGFVRYARLRFVSALHGTNVGHLFADIREAHASAFLRIPTPRLTRLMESALAAHPPPLVRGRRIKLRYAHQGGQNPPLLVFHGNQVDEIPGAYKRYLENFFRQQLALVGTPLRLEFRGGENPFAGRRNTLTPRQIVKRRRMMKHVKKGR